MIAWPANSTHNLKDWKFFFPRPFPSGLANVFWAILRLTDGLIFVLLPVQCSSQNKRKSTLWFTKCYVKLFYPLNNPAKQIFLFPILWTRKASLRLHLTMVIQLPLSNSITHRWIWHCWGSSQKGVTDYKSNIENCIKKSIKCPPRHISTTITQLTAHKIDFFEVR